MSIPRAQILKRGFVDPHVIVDEKKKAKRKQQQIETYTRLDAKGFEHNPANIEHGKANPCEKTFHIVKPS